MIKNAEYYKTIYAYTINSNEQTLEVFLRPQITIETSKVTHTK